MHDLKMLGFCILVLSIIPLALLLGLERLVGDGWLNVILQAGFFALIGLAVYVQFIRKPSSSPPSAERKPPDQSG